MSSTQSVIPIGAVLFIIAELLSLPELLRQARGRGIVDHDAEAVTDDRRGGATRP